MAERLEILDRKDYTGCVFGHLTVLETLWGYGKNKQTHLRCMCDCGQETIKTLSHIKRSPTKSCGCMITVPYKETNEIGQKFNRLTILEIIRGDGPAKARCRCDCGNELTLLKSSVTCGATKSCGCYQKERAINYNLKDYSGMISPHGIEILYSLEPTKKGCRHWMCRCCCCGEVFEGVPCQILKGKRASCGCLKRSSKEKMIDRYLQSIGVNFAQQIVFRDCVRENVLRFDFGIYDSDNKLIQLIEYDGGQHFFPVRIWGGEAAFTKIKERDVIKNEYCLNNNIPLLRLPYTLTDDEIIQEITNIINPKRL